MSKAFPDHGRSTGAVLAALTDATASDLATDGRAFAFIYDAGAEARALARQAFAACMGINGLDPTAYPSARTIENGLSAACLELLHAPEGAVATATAGGTESVMLAVKTARDYRHDVASPAILLPETGHACFHKAAHYLGLRVIVVDVDPVTFRADPADARAKMTDDVVLVVGSAPSYAHGVVDPIEALAALAAEYGALMHVDACVGGCVLPFVPDAPAFDFRLPGVTSVSMDLHKYGFAPKGISMLLQRRRDLRDAQYYACARWSGYAIVNSTTLGSKSAAAMGAAWALVQHLGRDGYQERVDAMLAATAVLTDAIDATDGVELVARPAMNLFGFTTCASADGTSDGNSDGTNEGAVVGDVFELADRLTECGWHVQPTYAMGRSPAHIHLTIDPTNAANAGDFAVDLARCVRDLPPTQRAPEQVVALLESLATPGQGGTGQGGTGQGGISAGMLMGQLGITDGRLPGRAAMIHRLLNAASPQARERLLVLFISELFS